MLFVRNVMFSIAKIYFLLVFLFISAFLYTQTTATYRLINSDQINVNKAGEQYITYLTGNVHFFYDELEFFADRAEIYEEKQEVFLIGNVKAVQDTLDISCNEAYYYHQTQLLRLIDSVRLTQTSQNEVSRIVTARSGTHNREKGEFVLTGDVFAHTVADSVFATSGYAFYDQNTGYGYMIQSPLIWRTGADSLSLTAQKIEFFEPINKVIASFGVVTQNSTVKATCDFLIYYGDEQQIKAETEDKYDAKIVYIGDPNFFSEDGDGNADLLTIYLVKNDISLIYMENNSYITFKTSNDVPKDSWIKSDFMRLYYANNKPLNFSAEQNVSSFFKQVNNKTQKEIFNDVEGNQLNIYFDDEQKVKELSIDHSVRGKYKFQR